MNTPATVSDRAKAGLDAFVAQAVKSSLVAPGTSFAITPEDTLPANEREVVMLTVSSYMFRVLVFMHVERGVAMRTHLATLAGVAPEAIDDERFTDELLERGNLCCGALNRDLAHFYPHIGMSTPCILKRSSVDHVEAAVKPVLTRRYRAEVGDGVAMHFTLALCAFADMDFDYVPRAVEEEEDTAGELEMF
ncbi:hypothetical protein ACVNIS_15665 [Sphaerotilaceae bacterium SBD11-9]